MAVSSKDIETLSRRLASEESLFTERQDYQKRINDLLNAVTTLLEANNAMGEKLQKLEKSKRSF